MCESISTASCRPSLSEERRQAAITAFAAILNISIEQVKVYRVYEGSIVFEIGIPEHAAERLNELLRKNDPRLAELGIYDLVFEDRQAAGAGWAIAQAETETSDSVRIGDMTLLHRLRVAGRGCLAALSHERCPHPRCFVAMRAAITCLGGNRVAQSHPLPDLRQRVPPDTRPERRGGSPRTWLELG